MTALTEFGMTNHSDFEVLWCREKARAMKKKHFYQVWHVSTCAWAVRAVLKLIPCFAYFQASILALQFPHSDDASLLFDGSKKGAPSLACLVGPHTSGKDT